MTLLEGTAPDFLDPDLGYTTQSLNATNVSYLPLYSYAEQPGVASTVLIPALATALPAISDGGKTYTITLRPNLKFSDGTLLKASDVPIGIERSLKLPWGGASFFSQNIVGAAAYGTGKAKTISGITTDDATGTVVFHLLAPYGAFTNVLAFPSAAPLPANTAFTNLSNKPPAGIGPYVIKDVVPNQSYTVAVNPLYAGEAIPGIAVGKVNVDVKVVSDNNAEAEQVLQNSADIFDFGDTLPPSLISQIQSQAADRFAKEPEISTFYFFMNTKVKPFSSQLAREAVATALDRTALARLDSGFITPDCYFLPVGMIGHPTAPCPYGDPNSTGNIAKAKALVQQSGMAGTAVTVYGENRSPRKQYIDYYTQLLNQIGFKATERIISDANYFPTVGNLKLNAQTGFGDWLQDFPNPIDFYLLLSKAAIQPTNNENFSLVDDPLVEKSIATLGAVPSGSLASIAAKWQATDEYVAKQAYEGVFGEETVPKFYSNRINFSTAVFSLVYGTEFNTLELK